MITMGYPFGKHRALIRSSCGNKPSTCSHFAKTAGKFQYFPGPVLTSNIQKTCLPVADKTMGFKPHIDRKTYEFQPEYGKLIVRLVNNYSI